MRISINRHIASRSNGFCLNGRCGLSVILLAALILPVQAYCLSFTGTGVNPGNDDEPLSAEAVFALVNVTGTGGQLQITLTNTATAAADAPSSILTALFFTTGANPALTPLSAIIATGSTVINGSDPTGGNVGGEWAYPGAPSTGLSSTGVGIWGSGNFGGPNLAGPESVNGAQFGIAPLAGVTHTNGALGSPFVSNSIVFTFDYTGSFDLNNIEVQGFQYGTSLTEPFVPAVPVPEPATVTVMGLGLASLTLIRRIRSRKAANK